jgi:hypothetical protein
MSAAMGLDITGMELGSRLGSLLSQIGPRQVDTITVRYHGPLTEHTAAPVTRG